MVNIYSVETTKTNIVTFFAKQLGPLRLIIFVLFRIESNENEWNWMKSNTHVFQFGWVQIICLTTIWTSLFTAPCSRRGYFRIGRLACYVIINFISALRSQIFDFYESQPETRFFHINILFNHGVKLQWCRLTCLVIWYLLLCFVFIAGISVFLWNGQK